jgi:uroporphyrin-III C-methyltransferase
VVGHGSRRAEANDDVRNAAHLIGNRGGFPVVEAAFLEIEQPDIRAGFERLIERGARHVIVHPYFLSPGRHTRGDIPVEVKNAAESCDVSYDITEPLSAHQLVIEASVDRIQQTVEPHTPRFESRESLPGKVYLVGAGPGDPGLLTVKARDLLTSCDVVVYDYLVNPEILVCVPPGTERIYVGKVGGGNQTPQAEINQLLIGHAKLGRSVVRLKGGDPFLFGRGAEEAEALQQAGILFEVVPGISSALAVPAYAGIPLTHRSHATSVAIVTGAGATTGAFLPEQLANLSAADTLVILMGVRHLRAIAAQLVACGRAWETPVAVVRWGTYDGQQTVTGTLSNIAEVAERSGMRSPAVIVVGEVVRLREKIAWFESIALESAESSFSELLAVED